MSETFRELGLEEELCDALGWMNIKHPTEIQQRAIPHILEGKDLIGCAQTGTGKTATFLLPVLNDLVKNGSGNGICAIIVSPTRELALQIDKQIDGIAYFSGISSAAVYGGGDAQSFSIEKKALTEPVDIITATPGRLLSHLNLGYADLSNLKYLILDEADRMLDMGFYDDIVKIVQKLPRERQTLLFSATMPTKIRQLAHKVLNRPEEISVAVSKTADGVDQKAYLVFDQYKIRLIIDIIKDESLQSVIIFCSTKQDTKRVSAELQKRGYKAKSFHSDLEQEEREKRMAGFKNKSIKILIGTDIISRGIDIEDISMVINYNVPQDAEDYVHRVGRTARAASTGQAVTFINDIDQRKFARIESLIKMDIPKLAISEEIGKGPEFDPAKYKFEKKKFKKRSPHSKGKGPYRRKS